MRDWEVSRWWQGLQREVTTIEQGIKFEPSSHDDKVSSENDHFISAAKNATTRLAIRAAIYGLFTRHAIALKPIDGYKEATPEHRDNLL